MEKKHGARSTNVRSLHPVRILVATRDSCFRRAAGFLFARSGFLVEWEGSIEDTLGAVERRRPHAVVLDASGSLASAARVAAAIEALDGHTRVLIVSDTPATLAGFRAFAKWASFDAVLAEIERTYGAVEEPRRASWGRP
jgi:DNA-binding NtrC family response regulator